VTLQLEDGCGVAGIVEEATRLLGALGYKMPPVARAAGFPDVRHTTIRAAAGLAGDAKRVQAVLGQGIISEDQTLDAERIVVVLGDDYIPLGEASSVTSD
jgi:hypothetical protein